MLLELDWCMARLVGNRLTIVSPSNHADGRYSPAESVVVFGKESLIALRDALNKAFPVEGVGDGLAAEEGK